MSGDERTRFCTDCSKHVYNLSAMTTAEAEELILEKEGHLCVRYYKRKMAKCSRLIVRSDFVARSRCFMAMAVAACVAVLFVVLDRTQGKSSQSSADQFEVSPVSTIQNDLGLDSSRGQS